MKHEYGAMVERYREGKIGVLRGKDLFTKDVPWFGLGGKEYTHWTGEQSATRACENENI